MARVAWLLVESQAARPSRAAETTTADRISRWRIVLNSLVLCLFARGVYDEEIILQGLDALGHSWDGPKLHTLGEEALKRKHQWKKLCGFGPADLKVPEKMYSVETTTGQMDRESLRKRLELYRQYSGIE